MNVRFHLLSTLAITALALASITAIAQQPTLPAAEPAAPPPATTPQTSGTQAPGARPFDANSIRAWSLLSESIADGKSPHDRIEALAALGTMGSDERAAHFIADAIHAHDSDVRMAAILAAGLTRNPRLIPALQSALDDDNPQVAYTAALTLWKMHDTSGEDLLIAAAVGDRKVKPGLIKSSKHKASAELHSPKTLATIGVKQGAGFFLGPFGVGITAIEYVGKSNGAAVARADAIDQLSQQHSDDVRNALIADLTDDEPAVRAAAAEGLARWPGEETQRQLVPLFGDNHLAVRLTAAAGYLRAANNIPPSPDNNCPAPVPPPH